MPRFFNVLIAINVLLPWIITLILARLGPGTFYEIAFFATVFVIAVGNARIARLVPSHAKWIWALSIANLIAAMVLGIPALATAIPLLLRL